MMLLGGFIPRALSLTLFAMIPRLQVRIGYALSSQRWAGVTHFPTFAPHGEISKHRWRRLTISHNASSHFSCSDVPGLKLATSQVAGTRFRHTQRRSHEERRRTAALRATRQAPRPRARLLSLATCPSTCPSLSLVWPAAHGVRASWTGKRARALVVVSRGPWPTAPARAAARPLKSRSAERIGANSERPRAPTATACIFPALRGRDQAFALRLFPGGLPGSSDGLFLLAVLALGRLFIRLTTFHFAKNALALHFLF